MHSGNRIKCMKALRGQNGGVLFLVQQEYSHTSLSLCFRLSTIQPVKCLNTRYLVNLAAVSLLVSYLDSQTPGTGNHRLVICFLF